jgi:hypothetical protein
MSVIVYYNFPKISLNLNGIGDPLQSIIQYTNSSGQTTNNIKYNEQNYSAQNFYFKTDAKGNQNYFLVECLDSNSIPLFIAIPLILSNDGSTHSKTDIDTIISSGNTPDIPLTLNNIISTTKNSISIYTSNNVVTVVTEPFQISTQTLTGVKTIQDNFNTDVILSATTANPAIPGTLQLQTDLDWVMTCELLTEDGEVAQIVEQESAAITITYFMSALIVVCFVYIVSPIFYKELFINRGVLAKLNYNHYAINFYFAIFFIVLSATFLIYGIRTNTRGFYFIFMAIILSFFSGRTAVFAIPGIANSNGTDFAKLDDPFSVFIAFFKGTYCHSPGLNVVQRFVYPLLFSIFGQYIVMFICIILFISTTIAGIVKQNISAFITGIVFYCFTPLYILGFIANT